MSSIKVKLGDQELEIGEFTLSQLEDMEELLINVSGYDKLLNRKMLVIALRKSHPNLTSEVVSEMKLGNVRTLDVEIKKIMKFAGFKTKEEAAKEKQPGEADGA